MESLTRPSELILGELCLPDRTSTNAEVKQSPRCSRNEHPGGTAYSSATYAMAVSRCGLPISGPGASLTNESSEQMATDASASFEMPALLEFMTITSFFCDFLGRESCGRIRTRPAQPATVDTLGRGRVSCNREGRAASLPVRACEAEAQWRRHVLARRFVPHAPVLCHRRS